MCKQGTQGNCGIGETKEKKKKNGASQAVFSFSTGLQKDSSVQVLILYHFYLFRIRISF